LSHTPIQSIVVDSKLDENTSGFLLDEHSEKIVKKYGEVLFNIIFSYEKIAVYWIIYILIHTYL
jgi:hypothetical protein